MKNNKIYRKSPLSGMWRLASVLMMSLMFATLWASDAEPFLTEQDYADFPLVFTPPGTDDPLFFNDLCQHARAREIWGGPRGEVARL